MRTNHYSILMATVAIITSCQEEDFNYTYEEVHRSAVAREYVKAFQAEFPEIDANHTWMCEPDTFYYNTQANLTRAAQGITVPTIENASEKLSLTNDVVTAALKYMEEAEDNRGKCAQNFEYLAIEETTYDIYPTFWGRKFCDHNEVGIYYIDASGAKHDLAPFWTDQDSHIVAVAANGTRMDIQNSTNPLTNMPTDAWNQTNPLKIQETEKCNNCNGTGKKGWNNCNKCGGTGKIVKAEYPVDHFEFPKYTLIVPAGMKWGLYLRTQKQQNGGDTSLINWYSNAEYNDGKSAAAATFTFGGVTYCSFEDAPMTCTNTAGTGTCSTCKHGHYDHDYNDIVLTITPRPIESTYKAIKYRVMCEDLGGTFDWDFNDVVYDVIYEEGKQKGEKATVSIVLQAVGGTLPIYLKMNGNESVELHELISSQEKDAEDLYIPVNVTTSYATYTSRNAVETATSVSTTITGKDSQEVFKIELAKDKYADGELDIRDYAKVITVEAMQHGTATSIVTFPDKAGNSAPQCFMTSVGTEWAGELQNICDKYPNFAQWVSSQKATTDWWNTDPNF